MKSKFKRSILICLIIPVSLFLGSEVLWAATPAPEKEGAKPAEVTKPSQPAKKGEEIHRQGSGILL